MAVGAHLYVPLHNGDVRPFDIFTSLDPNYPPPNWWAAKILGKDPIDRYKFEREFLDVVVIDTPRGYAERRIDFSKLQKGDFVEINDGRSHFQYPRRYWGSGYSKSKSTFYKVMLISATEVVLEEVTSRKVTMAFRPKATKTTNVINLPQSEIVTAYRDFVKAGTFDEKLGALAAAIGWMDKAVQRTVTDRLHPPDIEKRWGKIKKLRERAGHEATPEPERETCLVICLRQMQKLVAPQYVPKVTIDDALENMKSGKPLPKAATTATQKQAKSTGTTTAPPGSLPEVYVLAEAIANDVFDGNVEIKTSKVRVSIKHPAHSGTLFAMFSKTHEVQFMCPLLDKIGVATQTDRLGTPYVLLMKPIDENMIDKVKDLASKVKDLL